MSLEDKNSELFPVEPESPTPHRDKLQKLVSNSKLPEADRDSVRLAIEKHEAWMEKMDRLSAEGDAKVKGLVDALNEYLTFIELELIWDSEADFLFRQRGQIKLSVHSEGLASIFTHSSK